MNLPIAIPFISLFVLIAGFSKSAVADVKTLLTDVQTLTYDCPQPEYRGQVQALLENDSVTAEERFKLKTIETHYQNCNGQFSQAQNTLYSLLENDSIDKSDRFYAYAVYQLGFTYDVQEQDERCDYYSEAYQLAKGRFEDIEVSAELSLITYCPQSGYSSDAEKLAAFFSIVEKYSRSDNYALLAHVHNHIGLFFGRMGQHVMAADQFIKAHEMGSKVYNSSNKLSILISAITSLLATGQHEKAFFYIQEFDKINQDVSTDLTNYWYYHALSGYYYRAEKIDELVETLPKLKASIEQVNSGLTTFLYTWYSAVPCLYNEDTECLKNFISEFNKLPRRNLQDVNYDFQKFLVRVYFALGDLDAASKAFEKSVKALDVVKENYEGFSTVLGIANLYGKIYVLENQIEAAERRKNQIIFAGVILLLLIFVALVYWVRKRHIARMAIDPVTNLLNSKTAISEIAKVDFPSPGKSNAIAIFDLGNFREVNRQVGSTKGDFVLQTIASTLKQVTRDNDILGRLAPEQFILCLKDIEEESAKSFFERVQKALEQTFIADQHGSDISIRSSMSIYINNENFSDLSNILDDMLLSLSLQTNR
uniref:GGDEF domain-containing protein n=1 Tax=Ningiella ruwaisensis TaxID=2364274 RepID=UPI0010A02966|nr:GGDEF domain-containing protein [Ningiella ruwaisensis]